MSDSNDYLDMIKSIYDREPGEFEDLDHRQFSDNFDDQDPELQEQCWGEMVEKFQAAVTQTSTVYGPPEVRIGFEHEDADLWEARTQMGFMELAAWPRQDGQYFFISLDHPDHELPMLLSAGVSVVPMDD